MAELQARMSRREFGEWCAELDIRAEDSEGDEMADRVQQEVKGDSL